MAQQLAGNILKLNIIKVSKWFMLTMPIMMLFYKDLGFSTEESFQLKAFYSISIVIFEIPSGYMADVMGRRKTLILGSIFGTFGFVIYSLMDGFWPFLMAEMTLGFGMSCISGADSALLYDTLKAQGRENQYVKYEGRNFSLGNYAEALAGFLGGALAGLSLRYPFYVQTGIAFMAIPASILLVEPKIDTRRLETGIKDILRVVKYSLIDNVALRWNLIYSSIIGAATLTMAWVIQIYLNEIDFSEISIGFTMAILNLTVGTTTLFAYKIANHLQPKVTVWITTLLITGSFLMSGLFQSAWVIFFFMMFYISRGIATPVLKDYVNRLASSDIRATVLSIRSLIIRAFFAIIGPLFGWFTDQFSLAQAFFFLGLFFMAATGSSIALFLKSIESQHNNKSA